MMTAGGALDVMAQAIETGASDVLIKPFTQADFAFATKGLFGG